MTCSAFVPAGMMLVGVVTADRADVSVLSSGSSFYPTAPKNILRETEDKMCHSLVTAA